MAAAQTQTLTFTAYKHFCAIFQSEEEWRACLLPYFRQSLARQERFLYLYHKHTADEIMSCLSEVAGAAEAFACGQAVLLCAADIYYPEGIFDFEALLAGMPSLVQQALDDGYSGLCTTGEGSFVTEDVPGMERFAEYEARVEGAMDGLAFTCLCQYDTRYLPAALVAESMQLHRHVFVGGRVHTNRYYVAPKRFLGASPGEGVLESRLEALQAWTDQEEALHASEERYRLVADHNYDWEFWYSPQREMPYVSPSCESISGYTAQEFMSDPDLLLRITHPEDRQAVAEHVDGYLHNTEIGHIEGRIIRRDGEVRWISHYCQPIYSDTGEYLGRRASNRDITDRKCAEQQLAETNAQLQAVLAQAPVAIVLLNLQGIVELWSDGAEAIFGWQAAEVIGRPNPLIPPDLAPLYGEVVAAISQGHVQVSRDVSCLTKAGHLVETSMSVTAILDDSGQLLGLLGILTDITARKAAEAERERLLAAVDTERLQFRTVFEQAGIGMSIMGLNGRLMAANRALADMLGYAPDEMVGFTIADFTPPENATGDHRLGAVMLSGEYDHFDLEKLYLRKDGSHVWGRLMARLIRDTQGQPSQMVAMVIDITARKAAEAEGERLLAAVEAERLQFRTVFEQAGVGMVITDLHGRLTAANQAFAVMLGYTPDEMVSLTVADLAPGEDAATDIGRMSMHHGERENLDLERRYRRKDGSIVWGRLSARLIRDTQGRPAQIVAMVEDITAHKQATAASERLTAELEAIFASLTDAVAVYDREWNLVRANDRARWYCGAELDELNLEEIAERMMVRQPDGTPYPFSEWPGSDVVLGRPVTGLPLLIRTAAGEDRRISAATTPLWLNGEMAVAVISWHDVTGLHEAAEAARKRADELDTVIASIGDGVAIYDAEGRMLQVNRACREMLQWGKPLFDLTHEERRQQVTVRRPDGSVFASDDLPLARALRGEEAIGESGEIIRPDGSSLWVNSSANPLWNDAGELLGAVVTLTDITRLRKAQEELQHHRHHLEELVEERTAELQGQQLRLRALTSELALTEERERRRIATVIHDDVAQTLAFSKMRVAALRMESDPARLTEGHELLERLLDEAIQSARRIMTQLSPPVLYRMGFCPAIQWLGAEMATLHGYHVEVTLCDDAVPLTDDVRVTLFQAVGELLTNAAKYARASRVSLAVTRADDCIEVVVADDGVGFDPAQVQVTDSGGFGLFNIGERLACLGGSLVVNSAPGAGASFTLRAPLDQRATEMPD